MGNRLENQGVFIGPYSSPSSTSAVASFNEATLPHGGALGQKYRVGDKWYQLVQLESGALTAAANGGVAFWYDKDNFQVTTSVTRSHFNKCAGLFLGVPTVGYYCFIQIEGVHSAARLVPAAAAAVTGCVCVADTASAGLTVAFAANSQHANFAVPQWPPIGLFVNTSLSGTAPVDVMLRQG